MKSFVAAALFAAASAEFTFFENDLAFVNYLALHGKNYSNMEEYMMRKENYLKFDAEIKQHNER